MAQNGGGFFQKSVIIHAVVYVLVIGGLFMINQDVSPDTNWVKYVAWGWGVGLFTHAASWLLWGRR